MPGWNSSHWWLGAAILNGSSRTNWLLLSIHGTVFTLTTTLGLIDILAEVSGLGSFDEVRKVSKLVEAFGRQVRTLDFNGLIAAKRAAGRPKDLEALLELEGLRDALRD